MIKDNHYLAEKIISNIKNYKVIDEIIFSDFNNNTLLEEKNNKQNEKNVVKNVENNNQKINQPKNKIIQKLVDEPQVVKMPKEKNEKVFQEKQKNQFDFEFGDNSNATPTNVDNKENFNNLSINKKGMSMSNINQKHFENHLERDQSIDSYDLNNETNTVSMVDFLSEDSLSSIDDLNNIVNINDVYDDLGQNFQDDLINQYKELDKSVSRTPNSLKYSYLPKRKIRDILLDKYNIKNEECVNELYSMAFNNKWKEIDVEHWLLNPSNINNLISKCCENDYIAPQIKNDYNDINVVPKKEKTEKLEVDNNQEIKKEIVDEKVNVIEKPAIIPSVIPQNNLIEAKPIFHNQPQQPSSVKDDLKSVLIEENYRKMQFDFQTEILKNHIDSRFCLFNHNNQSEFSNRDSYTNKKINEEFINSRMDSFFNEKKLEILDEISGLKEKFTKNEKVIWESLDFIRKEMKQNQTSLTNSLSNSLKTIKDEIGDSLNSYIDEIQKKQNNSFNKLLENLDNKDVLTPLKESFDKKFETLSHDINQLKQNIGQKNNDLSIDFMDLRKEINERVNSISTELISNIDDLYDQVDIINESLKNIDNQKPLIPVNDEIFLKDNLENSNYNNKPNENNYVEKSLNSFSNENITNDDKFNKNPIKNLEKNENESKPDYLNFLENDQINFDNINSFHEQDMNYGNVNKELDSDTIDFDYLESSSNELQENQINDFDYDNSELSKKDRDFYKNFISDIPSEITNSSKIISNFDSKKTITNLDIENKTEVVAENKEEFDIKSKLSKIDEIIKNSISELNDIKEIVDDNEVRIDDSIKLFEKVK